MEMHLFVFYEFFVFLLSLFFLVMMAAFQYQHKRFFFPREGTGGKSSLLHPSLVFFPEVAEHIKVQQHFCKSSHHSFGLSDDTNSIDLVFSPTPHPFDFISSSSHGSWRTRSCIVHYAAVQASLSPHHYLVPRFSVFLRVCDTTRDSFPSIPVQEPSQAT